MRRNSIVYLVYAALMIGCGLGIYFTLQAGRQLEPAKTSAPVSATMPSSVANNPPPDNGIEKSWRGMVDNLREPLSRLLIQLILIVMLARLFGTLLVRLGQPAVIGEMIAGIVLGPSVAGALAPGAFQFIFPADSLAGLRMLSQVGVILFMFVVGMELDLSQLRSRARTAVMVSNASIVFPYFLGVLFSFYIYRSYAAGGTGFPAFALFMGIAMSITAFPVLARILEERGLTKSPLGTTALTCAAVNDVTAWIILAFVVAIVKAGNAGGCLMTIALLLVFVGAMLFLIKPLLRRQLTAGTHAASAPSRNNVVALLVMVFAAGLFTEVIGIHALFGAFMVGVCVPRELHFREHLREKLESFSSAFLLPLFFAFTGLRTQVGLMNDWESAGICAGLILLATLGKLGGSMLTARWSGMDWHDSFALGALMNTRGLVELIVLNIGLDLGILSPRIFTMMVIMALITTCMTGPLLSLGNLLRRKNLVLASESPPA